MLTGKVKWFNNKKGFGFLIPDNGGGDVFIHYSIIEMDGFKTLKTNQEVRYEAKDTENGAQATIVTFL